METEPTPETEIKRRMELAQQISLEIYSATWAGNVHNPTAIAITANKIYDELKELESE